ncbi:hypothetical protein AVV19_gp180 [Enterococcus phage EFDG1]|uniref:Uncharacterized protein n=1 Tax=Enterococcus phage EFDG1 TaxID=1597976 RepID=A0A0C5KKU8_9CAUD|nr:hypothetical protein AVV19_gp180 [Enterococcus phage EFDG1]AJP61364.1 hypothetical protein [Enterococcus phage EFDG1]
MEISTKEYYALYSDDGTRSGVKVVYEEDRRSLDEEDTVVEITIQDRNDDMSIILDTDSFLELMRELKYIEGAINDKI